MTPAGLVQTVTTSQATQAINIEQQPQPGPSNSLMQQQLPERKDSTEESTEDDEDEEKEVKFVQTDEDEEESSDDEELPLAKMKVSSSPMMTTKAGSSSSKNNSSPKIIYNIQSNKVDSSGLQATPPHPNEELESSLNKLSSPETSVSTSRYNEVLDTSGSTDG